MKEFRAFILRGNVVDLAIGVIIGAAFAAVVSAFTEGVVSPLIGLVGDTNFDDLTVCLKGDCIVNPDTQKVDGVLLEYGRVLTALLTFLITAAVLFFAVVRPVAHLLARRKTEPEVESTTKDCPECLSNIPMAATRCAFCTASVS